MEKEEVYLPDLLSNFLSPSTKPLWEKYKKAKDPYERVVILEKIVKVINKSSMEAYDKMKREQGRK